MATSKRGIRSTRKLRDWTVEQVESGKYPGLVWDDPPAKTMFRIPWKHAGKQEFQEEEDAGFFKAWAIYKGKYNPGENNPAIWKTRVRCALNKSPEFEEMPSRSRLDITEPYKVYRLVSVLEQMMKDFSLCMSVSYAGEQICQYFLPEGEYLITSVLAPLNGLVNCMTRFILPAPVKMADAPMQEIVQRLLEDLVKGIMVASNHEGIFIQCRGKVCVSWSGFLAPEGQIKLENDTYLQLFKPQEFRSALKQHQQGLRPPPDPRVILYIGDELERNRHVDCKPIVIQMEQTFAFRLRSSGCSLE